MKKVEAWAVLRFDADSIKQKDLVAIKGIYDTEEEAVNVFNEVNIDNNDFSKYTVLKTRRHVRNAILTTDNSQNYDNTTNTFWKNSFRIENNTFEFTERIKFIRDVWYSLPPKKRKRLLLPLLSYFVEEGVAKILHASLSGDSGSHDLILPTGEFVEVKTIIRDSKRARSSVIQISEDYNFKLLIIVILNQELEVEAARVIPDSVFSAFLSSSFKMKHKNVFNLRVTEYLLTYPGTEQIQI